MKTLLVILVIFLGAGESISRADCPERAELAKKVKLYKRYSPIGPVIGSGSGVQSDAMTKHVGGTKAAGTTAATCSDVLNGHAKGFENLK